MSHPPTGQEPTGRRPRGSYAVGEPRRKRPIWLWILLAIILLALLLFLLSRCGGSDTSKSSSSATSTPTASSTPTTTPTSTPTATPTATTSPSASTGSGADSSLTAGGTAVLAGAGSAPTGDLATYAGKAVRATGVSVQSVPADEGFWVGPSATDRVWVQLKGGTESGYTVKKGDRVDFRGTMVRHGKTFAEQVGVTSAEGAAQLTRESAHVRVRQGAVTLSKG